MNERKAVKYHDRLVAALRKELELSCSGGTPRSWDGACSNCGSVSCLEHHALLTEIEAEDAPKAPPPSKPARIWECCANPIQHRHTQGDRLLALSCQACGQSYVLERVADPRHGPIVMTREP